VVYPSDNRALGDCGLVEKILRKHIDHCLKWEWTARKYEFEVYITKTLRYHCQQC